MSLYVIVVKGSCVDTEAQIGNSKSGTRISLSTLPENYRIQSWIFMISVLVYVVGFFFKLLLFLHLFVHQALGAVCGILVPDGTRPEPLLWEHGVWATEPPRKSLGVFLSCSSSLIQAFNIFIMLI